MSTEQEADVGLMDEQAVVGAMMLSSEACDDVAEIVEPEDFLLYANRLVFESVQSLRESNSPVSPTTIADRLQKTGHLDEVGVNYLLELMESVAHAGHAAYHAKQVRKRATRRQFARLGTAFTGMADDLTREPEDIFGVAEQELHKLIERTVGKNTSTDIGTILADALDQMGAAKESGVKTGYRKLDDITLGFQKGHLILVGARPSAGKTAFACNLMAGAARAGSTVLFVSLEQSRLQLAERLLAMESKMDSHAIKSGSLGEDERDMVLRAATRMDAWNIFIDDEPGRTVAQIAARIRLQHRRKGVRFVIIDYLQIIEPDDRRASREQQVASMSRRLAILARQLEIPIVLLVQLNRQSHQSKDGRPALFHLRESGALEQDANIVMLLHRPWCHDPVKYPPSQATVIIAKNRDGKTEDIHMEYRPHILTFVECEEPERQARDALSAFETKPYADEYQERDIF